MSTYSDQISEVVKSRLIPKMQGLSMDVAKIEPYSYSSTILEDYKRQLDYYSMVYDFLTEYIDGSEELENTKLVNVVRLFDGPGSDLRLSGYLPKKIIPKSLSTPGYKIYIDKLLVNSKTILTPGSTINITVEYTPSSQLSGMQSIVVSAGGIVESTDGFSIVVPNVNIPLSSGGGNLVIAPQAYRDGIAIAPLNPPVVVPIKYTIEDVYYYGAAAPAATEAQIRALTKLVEGRGNKTLTLASTAQVIYFAYPQSYGTLSSIIDENGFDITTSFTLRPGVLFNLQSPNYGTGTGFYNVYEHNNITTVSDFKLTFNF